MYGDDAADKQSRVAATAVVAVGTSPSMAAIEAAGDGYAL
jgi:hypothetical protein